MTKVQVRGWLLLVAAAVSAITHAQGGAGGGFGGGVMQGNIGGREEPAYPPTNIDGGEEGSRWISSNAILTQGDKVEYKIKGVPGQTLFATVRSGVFDPALRLEDSKGKLVIENDDQYEGQQTPLLMYQFTDDKDYKLIVKNYRSSGGGAFRLYMQTFSAAELAVGENNKPIKPSDPEPGHGGNFTYFHFKGVEGKTYAIREVIASFGDGKQGLRFRGIIGPTGVKKTDYSMYQQFEGWGPLFEVKTKGDFYMVYDSSSRVGTVAARLDVVEVSKIEKVSTQKFDLGPTGQRIFKFDVAKEDIIHTISSSPEKVSFNYRAQGPNADKNGERPNVNIHNYEPKMFNDSDHIRVYEEKGEVTLVVSNGDYKSVSVSFSNSMDIPVWTEGTSITGKIGLGESKFFVIGANKGDIQRIKGSADGFELNFTLNTMTGEGSDYIDPRSHAPSAELRYTENRKYLMEVSSPQGGGSGTYTMTLEQAKPDLIELGKVFEYHDGPAVGTYAVKLEQGVRYQILSPANLGLSLLDEAGDNIPSQAVAFGNQTAIWFTPAKSGTVRLKVIAGPQGLKFRIDKHVLPGLG